MSSLSFLLNSNDLSVTPLYLGKQHLIFQGPGQVVKLSTSRRLAALLRAACHRGWCVCLLLSGWDIKGNSFLVKVLSVRVLKV